MRNYCFHDIFESMEFQRFAIHMIEEREGITCEVFGEGEDGGIDGRRAVNNGETIIVQAKRHEKYRKKNLMIEKAKLDNLKVDRYILVLSYKVSKARKEEIKELFAPYIISTNDIVGRENLNHYLDDPSEKYRKIEQKYHKLLAHNPERLKEYLNQIIHRDFFQISNLRLKEAIVESQYFVETSLFQNAIEKVGKNRVIIISGEPGMGKTTLAKQLALYFCRTDNVKYYWFTDIYDYRKIEDSNERNIMIFDDFWGSIFYKDSRLGREEKELAQIIKSVKKSKNDIFILTTRHYILEQGLRRHEELRRIIDTYKLECRLTEYTTEEKYQIYCEHINKAEVTYEQAVALYDIHASITESPNYNPRVIDKYLSLFPKELNAEDCQNELLQYLDRPEDFWEEIYKNLSVEAQHLYKILFLMPEYIDGKFVEKCYCHIAQNENNWKEYPKVIAELEKTVIYTDVVCDKMFKEEKKIVIRFQNPSMYEMIHSYLADNLEQNKKTLVKYCMYFTQTINLLEFLSQNERFDEYYALVMRKAFELICTDSILEQNQKTTLSGETIFIQDNHDTENSIGRFLDLFPYYKNGICIEFKDRFSAFFQYYLRQLKNDPMHVIEKDIITFPEVAQVALKEGIFTDAFTIIDTYMTCIMYCVMEPDYDSIRKINPSLFDKYVKQNLEKVSEHIYTYYRWGMYNAAMENAFGIFVYLEKSFHDLKKQYCIEDNSKFCREIDTYDGWLEYDREIYEQSNFQRIDLNIKEKMSLKLFDEKKKKTFIKKNSLPRLSRISKEIDVAEELVVKALILMGCNKKCAEGEYLAKFELEEILEDISGELEDDLISLFVEDDILVKRGKWYYVKNQYLFMSAFFAKMKELQNEDKEKFYRLLFNEEETQNNLVQLGRRLLDFDDVSFIKKLNKIDKNCFMQYAYIPLLKEFYEEIYHDDYETLVGNLLAYLRVTVGVDKEGMIKENSMEISLPLIIFECIEEYWISDMLLEQFTDREIVLLVQARLMDPEESQVELLKIYQNGLDIETLRKDEVTAFFRKIKAQLEGENESGRKS